MKSGKGRYAIERQDALEWLRKRKKESIHAVVTDPPYGIVEYSPKELKKRDKNKGIWRLPHAYDGYQRTSMPRFTVLRAADYERIRQFHARLSPELFRILVPGGHVLIACHNLFTHLTIEAFVASGFELRGQVARIVKTLRGGDRPKGAHAKFPDVSVSPRSCWEPWLIFRKPCAGLVRDNLRLWGTGALRRPSRNVPFSDLISAGPVRGAERRIAPHPSVKPQLLMRQLVRASLPFGKGVVLDPFMGSGSTIAAARALGMRSLGVEVNAKYFRMAQRAIPKLADLDLNAAHTTSQREPRKRSSKMARRKRQ